MLPSRQATTTLWQQHRSAASTMVARNMAHLDTMSPTSPRTWLKLSQRWALKPFWPGTLPGVSFWPSLYVWLCPILLASSPTTKANLPPGDGQFTTILLSSLEHWGYASANLMTRLQSWTSNCGLRCPGAKCTCGHLYAWTWCLLWTIQNEHSPATEHRSSSDQGGHHSWPRPSRFHCHCQREHWSHPGGRVFWDVVTIRPPNQRRRKATLSLTGINSSIQEKSRGQQESPHLPAASHCRQLQSERESNPSREGWFRSPCHASGWGWLYLVRASQPRAPTLGPSLSERWHSTSLDLAFAARDWTVKVPAFGCHQKSLHVTPLAPSAGGEPTEKGSHIASAGPPPPWFHFWFWS